ncbi:MAG: SDR family oxidoreductase [Mucilaginibacter sp.]|nr:SDR family oxidoreductase [Mucilaginibacter sp.]
MVNYLITGANSFLGKAITARLSLNPENRLLLVSRKNISGERSYGDTISYLPNTNLLNEDSLQQMRKECELFFTGPVHVINCVGYYKGQEQFEETSPGEAKKIFESNFTTVYNTAFAIMPYLMANGGGHFITFSCKSVRYRYPFMAPFSASKAALECLMGSLANEFSKYGVIANAFSLSTLDTAYERTIKPYGDYQNWLKLDDIAKTLEEVITGNFHLMNGNTIDLFQYSDSFFNKSYFDRIKK